MMIKKKELKGVHNMSNLTYIQTGAYQIRNITLSNAPMTEIGKYGQMRKKYLQEQRPGTYSYTHLFHLANLVMEALSIVLIIGRCKKSSVNPVSHITGGSSMKDYTEQGKGQSNYGTNSLQDAQQLYPCILLQAFYLASRGK